MLVDHFCPKVTNFCEILFKFLADDALSNLGLLLKERVFYYENIFSLRPDPKWEERPKQKWEMSSLKVYKINLI